MYALPRAVLRGSLGLGGSRRRTRPGSEPSFRAGHGISGGKIGRFGHDGGEHFSADG